MSKIQSLDLRRKQKQQKISKRQYAAAQYTSMTGDWTPLNATVNDEISSSSSLVTARIRQLVRDNPHFHRAVKLTSAYIVGSGIRYQSQVKDSNGDLDNTLNQYIEDKYEAWLDEMDIAGRLHGYDFQDLCCRQLSECGEFILVRRLENFQEYGKMPLRYQIIEPDSLSSLSSISSNGNEISQGIEYDPMTFKVIRYHFIDDFGRQYSMSANDVIHKFHSLRPNQLRGISDFTSGILLADAFRNYIDSELSRKAMAARWLAFVKSPDPLKFQMGLETDSVTGSKLEDIENATIQYLNPLEDITFPALPNDSGLAEFSELILQMYSVSTGIPYEALTQDYGSMSFATAKVKRTDLKNELKPAIQRFIRWQCKPIMSDFFRYGILSGYLELPENIQYQIGVWQPPGMEPVDPLREVKAIIEEIKSGLRSPQEYIRSRGADPDETLAAIAEFKTLSESYGLNFDAALNQASTMMANAPSKIDNDGEANEQ